MKVIAYLLGFGLIAIGSYLILYTRETVDVLKGLSQTYQLKYLSAIPAVFGILFLISAAGTTHPWVFTIIGLLAVGKAVLAFTDPQKIFSRMLDWYVETVSDQTQRFFGIIGIVCGTSILTWIK